MFWVLGVSAIVFFQDAQGWSITPQTIDNRLTYYLQEQFRILNQGTDISSPNRGRLRRALNTIHEILQNSFTKSSSSGMPAWATVRGNMLVESESDDGVYQEWQESLLKRLSHLHQTQPWIRQLISPLEIVVVIQEAQERWRLQGLLPEIWARVIPYLFWQQVEVSEFLVSVSEALWESGQCEAARDLHVILKQFAQLSAKQREGLEARDQFCVQLEEAQDLRWQAQGEIVAVNASSLCVRWKFQNFSRQWCYEPQGHTLLSEPIVVQGRLHVVVKDAALQGFPSHPWQDRTLLLVSLDGGTGEVLHEQKIYTFQELPSGGRLRRAPLEWPRPFGGGMPYQLHARSDGIHLVTEHAWSVFTLQGALKRLVDFEYPQHQTLKYDLAQDAFGHLVPRALELVRECQDLIVACPPQEPIDQRFALIENMGFAALEPLSQMVLDPTVSVSVRVRVAHALRYFPTPEVVNHLIQALHDPALADRVQWSLAEMGVLAIREALALLADITAPLWVRLGAVTILREQYVVEAEPLFIRVIQDEAEPQSMRLAMVEVFKKFHFKHAVEALIPLVKPDTSPPLLFEIVQALNLDAYLDPRSQAPLEALLVPEVASHIQTHARLVLRRLAAVETVLIPEPNTDAYRMVAGDGVAYAPPWVVSADK